MAQPKQLLSQLLSYMCHRLAQKICVTKLLCHLIFGLQCEHNIMFRQHLIKLNQRTKQSHNFFRYDDGAPH